MLVCARKGSRDGAPTLFTRSTFAKCCASTSRISLFDSLNEVRVYRVGHKLLYRLL